MYGLLHGIYRVTFFPEDLQARTAVVDVGCGERDGYGVLGDVG
jgi:hypothetical protein